MSNDVCNKLYKLFKHQIPLATLSTPCSFAFSTTLRPFIVIYITIRSLSLCSLARPMSYNVVNLNLNEHFIPVYGLAMKIDIL